ncbi:hypothetical protein COO60DRAFT_439523 [Scenedesmus sp. NREL 46B-D3]|nr:hypothetical protein COO60DRAFT_439523 [Scenedesmus sp. NREL 46B-D3]
MWYKVLCVGEGRGQGTRVRFDGAESGRITADWKCTSCMQLELQHAQAQPGLYCGVSHMHEDTALHACKGVPHSLPCVFAAPLRRMTSSLSRAEQSCMRGKYGSYVNVPRLIAEPVRSIPAKNLQLPGHTSGKAGSTHGITQSDEPHWIGLVFALCPMSLSLAPERAKVPMYIPKCGRLAVNKSSHCVSVPILSAHSVHPSCHPFVLCLPNSPQQRHHC